MLFSMGQIVDDGQAPLALPAADYLPDTQPGSPSATILVQAHADGRDLWERMPGEGARAFAAFAVYRDMSPHVRSINAVCREISRSRQLISNLSAQWSWVARAEAWDEERDKVARAAQLATIERITREDIELADEMLKVSLEAAKALDPETLRKRPQALAEIVKVATKARRDAAGIAEPKAGTTVTVAGDPNAPIQHEVKPSDLDPSTYTKVRDLALEVTLARARQRNGQPPILLSELGPAPADVTSLDEDEITDAEVVEEEF